MDFALVSKVTEIVTPDMVSAFLVALAMMSASAALGFAIARSRYKERVDHGSAVLSEELQRLKRRAVSAETKARRLQMELGRRRPRGARAW